MKIRARKSLLVFFTLVALVVLASSCKLRSQAVTRVNTPLANSSEKSLSTPTLVVIEPQVPDENTPTPPLSAGEPAEPSPTLELPQPNPWDGKGRVTILLLGLDYADWENTDRVGPPRSDTMILLTVDPIGKTAGILSIPRDLWVSMPGIQGNQKINTAHRFGELYQLPGGGPGLAMRTVEELLGVPVNFYARIDFRAFEDFIDELGGIEIDVPAQIKVDPIGPGNTVILEPGKQLLDGATALAYARNRMTENDDFDRSERQQQVILAIRERVLSPGRLPLLVAKAPSLYKKISTGIQTNLTLEQMIQLAWLAQEIPPENIQRFQIGKDAVTYATAPDGAAIDVPIPERIRQLRDQIFTTSIEGQTGGMTFQELVAAEYVRITLVNQTGNPELGKLTAQYLEGNGLNVIDTVQSDQTRPLTRLVDLASNPYTLRSLINLLHVSPSEIYVTLDMTASTDMLVYLGEDWAKDNPLK